MWDMFNVFSYMVDSAQSISEAVSLMQAIELCRLETEQIIEGRRASDSYEEYEEYDVLDFD